MQILLLTLLISILSSCQSHKTENTQQASRVSIEFIALSTDNNITGSILIYDSNKNAYYSNDFNWAKIARIPASTFKIPNSLIALELGIVDDANSVFKWDGEKRLFKIWQQDLTLKQAFHYSCVPCYQEIARKIGEKRMNAFVDKFNYGMMDIHADNIDDFWLHGKSKISQFAQIDFLKRLYFSQLPISRRTEHIFKQMFIAKQTDDYTLRAKTGLAVSNGSYNGWYVGYLEKNENIYFFATNINPKDKYHKSFTKQRKNLTIKALQQLNIL
jgi:beta-lactamase class D